MTENPTVPSPPILQQLSLTATSTPTHESGDSSGEIQCICEYDEDDGYTICCDACGTWQHIACMQLREGELPEKYLCSNCLPRPVDARKAKELQRQRRRDEKRKRSANASHKKKEAQRGGQNGYTPCTAPPGSEKTGVVKLPSPREPQPPTARKRNQRTSHSNQGVVVGTNNGTTVGSGSGSPVYLPDRNGDVESDTDLDKYKYEFNDIDRNKHANEEVKSYLSSASTTNEGVLKRFMKQDLSSICFPKTSVQNLPDSSKSYSEHSRWCFVLDSPCSRGKPVALFIGEVGFQETYKQEPINQYGLWNHPKPYVIFHPELPIYIDARRFGSEARFVRRSCRPNVCIKTIVTDDSGVFFALFASEPIKAGTELTLGWDWNGSTQLQYLGEGAVDLSRLTADEMKQAAPWVDNLIEKMGDCACAGPPDCLLAKIKSCGDGVDSIATKRPLTNGTGKRQRIKRNPSTESTASKEPTPDLAISHPNDDDDDDFKASVKVKPRSRDLTPSLPQETAVESGTMTGREARKFKDVLSRIEKQTQEQQVQPNKRRKRSSMASLPTGTTRSASPGSENARGIDEPRKQKSRKTESPATSPGSSNAREVSVVDASTGRSPGSSTGSQDHQGRSRGTQSKSPGTSSASSKVRRKMKARTPKSNYVNSSMQTEPDDELPWWKLPPMQNTPPRPPRLPLRKRLMQSLLRDREVAASSVMSAQDKKRKHDCFAEDTTVSLQPPKIARIGENEDAARDKAGAQGVTAVAVSPSQKPASLSDASPSYPGANAVEGFTSLRPPDPGPALGDLFADSDQPRGVINQIKPQQNGISPVDKPSVNGFRSFGLNLQVPSSNSPNGSISPSQSTPGTTGAAHTPLSGSAFPPSVIASIGTATTPVSPSPTKKKIISLKEYSKRNSKSVDTVPSDKKDEAAVSKSVMSADHAKQPPFLIAPAGELLPASPSPQAMTIDSKAIPGGVR
ncbi:hypothetical protein BDD12DRAFT_878888 [Trichophaea hybrida]|nr:hypothetical protein BDD12DRAFT_878888 [Trichophaea hybrida]